MKTQTSKTQRRHYGVIIFGAIAALIAIGILVAVVGGGSASGGNYGAGSSMKGMQMVASASGQKGAPVATTTVGIKNFAFTPATITVKVGSLSCGRTTT